MTINSAEEEKYWVRLTVFQTVVYIACVSFVSMTGTMFACEGHWVGNLIKELLK